ncbi:hypothetical protein G7Y79_00005g016600 [Physcia stellaris]|nr:hypothetical protein G7Y79_00005g016600 [Physcia stellaris]
MSDLLRREAQRPTSPFAEEINSKLPKGILVSSDAAIAALRSYLEVLSDDKSRRILLDGFPRNLDQAQKFRQEIGEVMGTVVLPCQKDIALRRLEQRNRDDDDIAIAEHRLQSHLDETVPMIEDYLSKMDRPVCQVDSNGDAEQVWVEFQNVLSEILKSWQ